MMMTTLEVPKNQPVLKSRMTGYYSKFCNTMINYHLSQKVELNI